MLEFKDNTFTNGYLERKVGGKYEGRIAIEGVELSPIEGVYFKEGGKSYLWLKRKAILEYNYETQEYKPRPREPRWEAYLQKQSKEDIAYKGEFVFLHFKYSIVGIWDKINKDKNRINFFIERLPLSQQTIINNINERNKREYGNEE